MGPPPFLQAGLEGVVRDMYISAEELGENVDGSYRRHEARDFRITPLEHAQQHTIPVRTPCLTPRKGPHWANAGCMHALVEAAPLRCVRIPVLSRDVLSCQDCGGVLGMASHLLLSGLQQHYRNVINDRLYIPFFWSQIIATQQASAESVLHGAKQGTEQAWNLIWHRASGMLAGHNL